MGDLAKLFKVTNVVGYEVPTIHPDQYKVSLHTVVEGEPNYNPAFPNRILWHSKFTLSCCEGCGCCFPWCLVVPKCQADKDVHDYITPGTNAKGQHTMTIEWTESFGCCGVCCGCEHGKVFTWIDVNGYQIFVAEKSETFVFGEKITSIPEADRTAITNGVIAAGLRPGGWTMLWY